MSQLNSLVQVSTGTGNLKLVQLLLEAGADPDIGGDIHFKTPLEKAIVDGNEAIVKLLLFNGVDLNLLEEVDTSKNLLRVEQQGRSVNGMEQILLDWDVKSSTEKTPPANPF